MPEGDTLYRHAATLRPILVGKTVLGLYRHGIATPLAGRLVESVEATGKHLIITLERGATVHIHLGIGGRILRLRATAVEPAQWGSANLVIKTIASTAMTNGRAMAF